MRTKKGVRQQRIHEERILNEIKNNHRKKVKKRNGEKMKNRTKTPKDRHPLQTARLAQRL